jgi:hypothetical protein
LRTGFPFGHYYFTDVMGPKIFQLPVLLLLHISVSGMPPGTWLSLSSVTLTSLFAEHVFSRCRCWQVSSWSHGICPWTLTGRHWTARGYGRTEAHISEYP